MFAGGFLPPKTRAAVLVVPEPAASLLAWFKSPTSVQALPFHDSFKIVEDGVPLPGIVPVENKPDVVIPVATPAILALLISVVSVHAEPFQDSTLFDPAAGAPE